MAAFRSGASWHWIGGAFYGPRIGLTYLSPPVQRLADSNGVHTGPVIMQFGWQWEQRFVISAESPMLASAWVLWVLMVGGAEQGHLLPSLSWLLAARGTGGGECGIGPVVSTTGVNLAITAGVSTRHGDVYIPWKRGARDRQAGPPPEFSCRVQHEPAASQPVTTAVPPAGGQSTQRTAAG